MASVFKGQECHWICRNVEITVYQGRSCLVSFVSVLYLACSGCECTYVRTVDDMVEAHTHIAAMRLDSNRTTANSAAFVQ